MGEILEITVPFDAAVIESLTAGQMVYLSGTIYTARDAAHKQMVAVINNGHELDFDINNQVVYYAGPCPAKPGQVVGSIGPTTSGRMDAYAPKLIENGLKFMIGKGVRSKEVKDAIVKNKGLYFAAIGGAGAIISKCVTSVEIVAFDELGTEAVRRLTVDKMPLIVAVDSKGNDVYEIGVKEFTKQL